MVKFICENLLTEMFHNLRVTLGDTLLIILGLVIFFVFIFLLQYKGVQIFAGVALFIALICSSVFSIVKLETYYSATGGVVGTIESFLRPNQVDELDNKIGFSLENLMMTKDIDGNYSVSVISEKVFSLENGTYLVYVNESPCKITSSSSDYIEANYSYVFYDKNHNAILDDTLYLQIVFYKTKTELTVYTTGGVEAQSLWQAYFTKNEFEIVVEQQEIEVSNQDFEEVKNV